jgi:hypothetical protein
VFWSHTPFCSVLFAVILRHSSTFLWQNSIAIVAGCVALGTVDEQIKLGQKLQSHKSKFTNLHRLITALSQIG